MPSPTLFSMSFVQTQTKSERIHESCRKASPETSQTAGMDSLTVVAKVNDSKSCGTLSQRRLVVSTGK